MKIKRKTYDWISDIVSIVALIGTIIFIAIKYGSLPDEVPSHYDALGNITSYGPKWNVWIMPLVALALLILLEILERFPETWNTGIQANKRNKEAVYGTTMWLMSSMKWINTLFMCAVGVMGVFVMNMPIIITIIYFVLLIGCIIMYVYKLKKISNTKYFGKK